MYNLINDLFFNWDKDFYNFSRPVHDQAPYKIITKDDKIVIVHNVVGIDIKDIKIDIEAEDNCSYLVINGKTHNDELDYDYSVGSRFRFAVNQIKEIEYRVENGLLYIEIFKKEQEKPQISIREIK